MSSRRRQINDMYRESLAKVPMTFMPVPEWSHWNGWLTCVDFASGTIRDRVMEALDAADIEARPLWKPLHLQPAFAGCRAHIDGTSEGLFDSGLCLPSGSALTDADVERIANIVSSVAG
jgi:dTDP-4-amino-4,6-dideoxygalactose transaminase